MFFKSTIFATLAVLAGTSSAAPAIAEEDFNTTVVPRVDLAGLDVTFYENPGCQGAARDQFVRTGSCATPNPGFSSVFIRTKYQNAEGGPHHATIYSKGDCGCPTCGSHGYDAYPDQCLTDIGFVGNAIGVY